MHFSMLCSLFLIVIIQGCPSDHPRPVAKPTRAPSSQLYSRVRRTTTKNSPIFIQQGPTSNHIDCPLGTKQCFNTCIRWQFNCDTHEDCPESGNLRNCTRYWRNGGGRMITGQSKCSSSSVAPGPQSNLPSREANAGEFPWMAYFVIKHYIGNSTESTRIAVGSCGGTLISNQWVLTSSFCLGVAHAGTTNRIASLVVTLGSTQMLERFQMNDDGFATSPLFVGIQIQAETIVFHPEHSTPDFDFVLIKLRVPVETNHLIRPLCLPEGQCTKIPPSRVISLNIDNCSGTMKAIGWVQKTTLNSTGIFPEPMAARRLQVNFVRGISQERCFENGNTNRLFFRSPWSFCTGQWSEPCECKFFS